MFKVIRDFLSDFEKAEEPKAFLHSQRELAQAALMYHVIAVDGVIRAEEKERMAEVLQDKFELGEDETADMVLNARDAEQEAVDLYRFTSQLVHALDEEERVAIVESLWEMVFADGVVHELEDNAIWRIAELLGVSTRDRMVMKQRVWKRVEGAGEQENG